jgi:hypothetical protein
VPSTNCLNNGVQLTKNYRCANLVCLNQGVHPMILRPICASLPNRMELRWDSGGWWKQPNPPMTQAPLLCELLILREVSTDNHEGAGSSPGLLTNRHLQCDLAAAEGWPRGVQGLCFVGWAVSFSDATCWFHETSGRVPKHWPRRYNARPPGDPKSRSRFWGATLDRDAGQLP